MFAFSRITFLFVILIYLFFPRILVAQNDSLLIPFTAENYEVEVRNMETINSPFLEFSPVSYLNGIVFVSSRIKNGWKDLSIKEPFFQLFYAEEAEAGRLMPAVSFSATINSHLHEGPADFALDDNLMFFTRNNLKKGARKADDYGVVRLKIYSAQKGLFDWEKIEELPFNSDLYSSAHPSSNEQGTILFFASDRPGGMGGMDLYVSEKKADTWSEPQNLGPHINTSGNELFPFFSEKGLLFFASDGHAGAGGLDLFVVSTADYSKVFHLSSAFNSPEDDFGLFLLPQGNRGYFSSSKSGGFGKDDIYSFTLDEFNLPEQLINHKNVAFQLLDAPTQSTISQVELRIFKEHPKGFMGSSGNLYVSRLIPSENSTENLSFRMVQTNLDNLGPADFTANEEGIMDIRIRTRIPYLFLFSKPGFEPREMVLTWSDLSPDSLLKIELSPVACRPLEVTILNGNTKTRLPNALISIKSLDDRFYFNKLFESDAEGIVKACLPPVCNYQITASTNGFGQAKLEIAASQISQNESTNANIYLWPDESIMAGTNQIKEGMVIVLNSIYYDFNKSAIRKGAARELDELTTIMKTFPEMEIELISHTDSRGSRNYNQSLSESRSRSAKDYLVARGIEADRIKASGKGESKIRNRCIDGVACSEEEHQFNRRTEVQVTKINAPVNIEYKN